MARATPNPTDIAHSYIRHNSIAKDTAKAMQWDEHELGKWLKTEPVKAELARIREEGFNAMATQVQADSTSIVAKLKDIIFNEPKNQVVVTAIRTYTDTVFKAREFNMQAEFEEMKVEFDKLKSMIASAPPTSASNDGNEAS